MDTLSRITEISFTSLVGTSGSSGTSDYTYDLFDRRIEKSVDADRAGLGAAVADHFAYDGTDIVLTLDVNAGVTSRLLHGPAIDQVLASEDAVGDILWPLVDQLGSVRDIIDSDGNVENHILYNSFGEVVSETDSALGYLFGFMGRERDVVKPFRTAIEEMEKVHHRGLARTAQDHSKNRGSAHQGSVHRVHTNLP